MRFKSINISENALMGVLNGGVERNTSVGNVLIEDTQKWASVFVKFGHDNRPFRTQEKNRVELNIRLPEALGAELEAKLYLDDNVFMAILLGTVNHKTAVGDMFDVAEKQGYRLYVGTDKDSGRIYRTKKKGFVKLNVRERKQPTQQEASPSGDDYSAAWASP